jgi:hypothetical protein
MMKVNLEKDTSLQGSSGKGPDRLTSWMKKSGLMTGRHKKLNLDEEDIGRFEINHNGFEFDDCQAFGFDNLWKKKVIFPTKKEEGREKMKKWESGKVGKWESEKMKK